MDLYKSLSHGQDDIDYSNMCASIVGVKGINNGVEVSTELSSPLRQLSSSRRGAISPLAPPTPIQRTSMTAQARGSPQRTPSTGMSKNVRSAREFGPSMSPAPSRTPIPRDSLNSLVSPMVPLLPKSRGMHSPLGQTQQLNQSKLVPLSLPSRGHISHRQDDAHINDLLQQGEKVKRMIQDVDKKIAESRSYPSYPSLGSSIGQSALATHLNSATALPEKLIHGIQPLTEKRVVGDKLQWRANEPASR